MCLVSYYALLSSPLPPSKMQFKMSAVFFYYSFRLLQSSKYPFPHQGNTFPAGETLLSCKTHVFIHKVFVYKYHKVLWYLHVSLLYHVAEILCNALDSDCYWYNLPEFPLSGRCVSLLNYCWCCALTGHLAAQIWSSWVISAGQLFCWISQRSNF